jgi:PKD repeat protein
MRLFTRSFLPLLLIVLTAFCASGQLTAGFTASPVAGCAPLVSCFTNTTTPSSGTTYDWDLGNGTGIIHLVNPCGSYLTPGTYTVTLTAHNGSSTSVYTRTITVYPSPTVNFVADDTAVCPGTPVTFTSTTVGGVPGPVTTSWAFGDGGGGSGSPVTHTYTTSGYKNVTLTATNADGCVASVTKTAYIHVYTPPVANFTAAITHFCHPPGHAVFTPAPTGTAPFTYVWTFGDGSPSSTSATPTHDYLSTGSYTVKMIVTDANGCVDSITRTNYITVENLHAEFTLPSTACVNTLVTFPNTSSAHLSSNWNYGDFGTGSTETGAHIYGTAGTYSVRLIVCDGPCCDTVYHNIVILPAAVASFTISPVQPCPAPATMTFTGTVPSGCTVVWLYGDGGSGTGSSSSHTYTSNGCYNVRMIVTNASGCIDTFLQNFCIYDLTYHIGPGIDTAGCTPLTVNFHGYATTNVPGPLAAPYPYPLSTYTWDFGDGSPTGSGPTPTHIYTAPGVYLATVTVVTANGCTTTASITILVGNPPVITVTGTPLHQCFRNNDVGFTATVISGPVDNYDWTFGDGTGITTTTPTVGHHYVIPGLFSVTVTPYYHGCPGPTIILPNYVLIDSPMAVIRSTVLCMPARRVVLGDSSLGDDTHLWMFGDATTSTVDNPVHDYALPIVYTITLATYNASSGCRDTASVVVDLHQPLPVFTTPDTAICRDDYILFTSSVIGGVASNYWWHSSSKGRHKQ